MMKQLIVATCGMVALATILLVQPARAQSMALNLAPHGSKLIENTFSFSLNATCTMTNDKGKNTIKLKVVENTGTVNGQQLTKGQSTSLVVKGQKSISVHAEPGSKVNIQNLSDNPLQATCSV